VLGLPQGDLPPVAALGRAAVPDLRYWSEPDKGGHFAALEQPAIFVNEVRAAFRLIR
jgi:pimeloyl-ACP methyl ester carboxylesterase